MKTIVIIAALAALGIAGCQKPVAVEERQETQELIPEEGVFLPAKLSTPAPAVPKSYVPPPPPPDLRTLAPEGVFFLIVHKSVTTDDGITGFPPGTQVSRVRPGIYLVGGKELELRSSEVTNDLALARSLRHLDIRNQAVVRHASAATPEPATPVMSVGPAAVNHPAVVAPQQSALDLSAPLGTSHSRYKDGWLWQRDSNGEWRRVSRLK